MNSSVIVRRLFKVIAGALCRLRSVAILILIAFIMPGFIAGRVLSSAHGTSEAGEGRLVLGAITLSCLNYAVLSWLLVLAWTRSGTRSSNSCAARLFHPPRRTDSNCPRSYMGNRHRMGKRVRVAFGLAHPFPSLGFFFRRGIPCWIVATLKGGRVIAGLYAGNSFASSFPVRRTFTSRKYAGFLHKGKSKASQTLVAVV